ncbi:MAG: nuclear transport factor 2 family protein [Blastochloris sp.]|nr:nuclear transport factor 2 family protein [Blastochloris sp.]
MTVETHVSVQEIVRKYFDAWTNGDIVTARQYLSDDLLFSGTLKSLNNADDYIVALGEYRKLVTHGNAIISELYGDDEAILIYDSHTVAGTIRIAEHIRLTNNKLSAIILILDPTELLAFKASVNQQQKVY